MGMGTALANAIGSGLQGAARSMYRTRELDLEEARQREAADQDRQRLDLARLAEQRAQAGAEQEKRFRDLQMAITRSQLVPANTPLAADTAGPLAKLLPELYESKTPLASRPISPEMGAQAPERTPFFVRRETPQEELNSLTKQSLVDRASKERAEAARIETEERRRSELFADPKFQAAMQKDPQAALRFAAARGVTADPALVEAARQQSAENLARLQANTTLAAAGIRTEKPSYADRIRASAMNALEGQVNRVMASQVLTEDEKQAQLKTIYDGYPELVQQALSGQRRIDIEATKTTMAKLYQLAVARYPQAGRNALAALYANGGPAFKKALENDAALLAQKLGLPR